MTQPRLIIIGAGPCGLGAGWRLRELGHTNFHIFEKEQYAGGLATSFVDPKGFTWDIGGHVLHSHYAYFDRMFEEVMQGEYFTHQRESWIWVYNRFIPYPFQNNIHRLPGNVMHECLKGLKKVSPKNSQTINTFADWIIASFGHGIAKHFLLPYNKKVWAYPPKKMSFQWVGDRVATVDITRIEKNIKEGLDDVSWGPNAVFHFPKHGGTGDIWKRVGKRMSDYIVSGVAVERIDAKTKTVYLTDGSWKEYDALLTTMPLDRLIALVDNIDLPEPKPLHFSSVTIIGLGIRGQTPAHLSTKCWMYFPQDHAPFFRATVFSNYSKFNAPTGCWSLMTETSSSAFRALPKGDIVTNVIQGAKRARLVPCDATLESTWAYHSPYGYPTPTLGRDGYLKKVLPVLEKNHIYSRGRFGAWKYEVSNQDHTFMQGVEWVDHILQDKQEITLYYPKIVNAPK